MSDVVLKVNNISKQYRLGQLGTGTISHDLNRAWAKLRGKEDPYLKLGDVNDRTKSGNSDYVWSLKDINFEVKRGDVLGIIGRNGAGKSTLLKILSQVTTPTTGEVKVKGRIAALLEVGTGFHPDLSGRENVFLNGAILGMTKPEIKSKFDEIVSFSGIERYIDTPVKRYSSGMTVRLAFAVAAHLDPEILIIDEVLAVGDAEFQKKCLGKMKDVGSEGKTVIFVSHNMLAIKSLCTTGMWLNNGTLKAEGTIDDVVSQYLYEKKETVESSIILNREAQGFHLHSVKITDNGTPGNFDIGKDLVFEIKATSTVDFEAIHLEIFFNTQDGVLIFITASQVQKVEKGSYIYRCVVPANTLNDEVYAIGLVVGMNESHAIHEISEITSIKGVEENRDSAWLSKYPGLIRPKYFDWKKIPATF